MSIAADICPNCERPIQPVRSERRLQHGLHGPLVAVVVRHAYKGCDTGCCGHVAAGLDAEGNECDAGFEFEHPWGVDYEEFARTLAGAAFPHVPLAWADCEVSEG